VLNPATPLNVLDYVIDKVDMVLLMSVNPGFGGQSFIPQALDKARRARTMLDRVGSSAALEMDGGIARDTIADCARVGVDAFVAGNSIFTAPDPRAEIGALRSLARSHEGVSV
jgi:ribulose-phosphate 3-epimerase